MLCFWRRSPHALILTRIRRKWRHSVVISGRAIRTSESPSVRICQVDDGRGMPDLMEISDFFVELSKGKGRFILPSMGCGLSNREEKLGPRSAQGWAQIQTRQAKFGLLVHWIPGEKPARLLHAVPELKLHGSCPDVCQDPKKIRDPGSSGSRIRDLGGSWILYFHFPLGSYRSWILSRQYCWGILGFLDLGRKKKSAGSWRSWIQLEQISVGSCRYWILPNNNVTVFWTSFTSN